jgi:O-acetyl-ADP-ribose deacetylase (regulator of RNase III)
MNVVTGNLLDLAANGHFDVLIHGCNCQCTMGAGIAKQIKQRFPAAFEADLRTSAGAQKLGTISFATVTAQSHSFTIVNGYTQVHWRGNGVKVDYEAVRSVMRRVKSQFPGSRIGYPRLGAGLAGGDWQRIAHIIAEELAGENHTLVEYAL